MEEVVCDICIKEYDERCVVPRVLECGHSVCSDCIDQLLQTSSVCPKCRNVMSQSSCCDYPINYSLIGIANSLNNSSTVKAILQRRIDTIKKQFVSMETKLTESKLTVDSNLTMITNGVVELQHLSEIEEDDLDMNEANSILLDLKDKLDASTNMKVVDYFKLVNSATLNLSSFTDAKNFLFEVYNSVSRGERFYTVTKIADKVKYGRISVNSNRMFIHAFSSTEVDQGAKTVWDIKESLALIKFFAFLEITCNDQGMRMMVLVQMMNRSLVPQFLRLCTGESGPMYKGSPFYEGSVTVNHATSVIKVDKFMENGKESTGSIEYFANLNVNLPETLQTNDVFLTASPDGSFQMCCVTSSTTFNGVIGKVEEPLNLSTLITHGTERSIFDSGIVIIM